MGCSAWQPQTRSGSSGTAACPPFMLPPTPPPDPSRCSLDARPARCSASWRMPPLAIYLSWPPSGTKLPPRSLPTGPSQRCTTPAACHSSTICWKEGWVAVKYCGRKGGRGTGVSVPGWMHTTPFERGRVEGAQRKHRHPLHAPRHRAPPPALRLGQFNPRNPAGPHTWHAWSKRRPGGAPLRLPSADERVASRPPTPCSPAQEGQRHAPVHHPTQDGAVLQDLLQEAGQAMRTSVKYGAP